MNNIYKLTIAFVISLCTLYSSAQTFEIRTVENDYGYLSVQMRETSGIGTPTTATNIVDITFVVRYPAGAVDIALICTSNAYNIIDGLAGEQNFDGYDYHYWNASNTPFNPPNDWTVSEWEEIAVFEANGSTGIGLFEIAPNNWDNRSLNWNQNSTDYSPNPVADVTYSYPTIVYDYVWVGATSTDWNSFNWADACGGLSFPPTAISNVFIPDVSSASGNFPSTNGGVSMECKNLRIETGAQLTVPVVGGSLAVSENLYSAGTISIVPNADATVTGDTYLNAEECLIVQADETGIGSFIDNGSVYGTGSAKVQTFLTNGASSGSFQIHLVGPTVNTTGSGAQLSDFDYVPGDTYAYEYDEGTDTWVNLVNPPTLPIPTAKGIGISTTDATDHTLEMTGELVYGTIYSETMSYGGTGIGFNLLSNPYPSSIFWNDMYADNSSKVNDIVYVWDASFGTGGNYRAYNVGSGGTDDFTGYIQVGQGFFVQAASGSKTFEFNTGQRHHSADPFYAPTSMANRLDVRVAGTNYRDGLLVHFYAGANSGFETNEDAPKRDSPYDKAPEIWTNLEDGSRLSINALPDELLGTEMLSVPLSFKCGLEDEYTITILDMESFEQDTEIWLEDKQTGDDWILITSEFEYTFSAAPDDPKDRFELHFFGPTGLDEMGAKEIVDIYSNRNYAYVINNTDELIKKVEVYTLSGGLVFETKVPDQKIHKLYVANEIGYYLVKVTTDKEVYTNKIFISF